MNLAFLVFPAVILLVITSTGLLISRSWRASIGLLALQYVGVFILVYQSWPVEMAMVKLIAGWISAAVIGLMVSSTRAVFEADEVWPAGRLFRLFMVLLVIIAVWSVIPQAMSWLPGISPSQMAGGLILISMGILHLSLITLPLRVILGLFTFLAGFEILYAAVESSILVAGLLSGITLTLALIGAFLLSVQPVEEEV